MPELCRFFGIVIAMYYNEHVPPHFHAIYGAHKAEIGIQPLSVLRGGLPPRATALVMEWATLHQAELLRAWRQRETGRRPGKIAPLE